VCGVYQTLKWGQVKWERDPKGPCGGPVRVRTLRRAAHRAGQAPDDPQRPMGGHRPWIGGRRVSTSTSFTRPGPPGETSSRTSLRRRSGQKRFGCGSTRAWGRLGGGGGDRRRRRAGRPPEDYGIGTPFRGRPAPHRWRGRPGRPHRGDRLGIRPGEESWVIRHSVFRGNPETSLQCGGIWTTGSCGSIPTRRRRASDRIRLRGLGRSRDAAGVRLLPQAGAAADLGDHRSLRCRAAADPDLPRRNRAKVVLGIVGTDTAKGLLFSRLGLSEFGPVRPFSP